MKNENFDEPQLVEMRDDDTITLRFPPAMLQEILSNSPPYLEAKLQIRFEFKTDNPTFTKLVVAADGLSCQISVNGPIGDTIEPIITIMSLQYAKRLFAVVRLRVKPSLRRNFSVEVTDKQRSSVPYEICFGL